MALFASVRPAFAEDANATFARGREALGAGRYNDAIAEFERLSDLGERDANASFNRALSYLGRAETGRRREGDLGQAAAGFREAALLGDASPETENALERVRHVISRERAQRGQDPVVVRPALGRAVLQVVPEAVWAVAALVASLTLAVGLLLRGREKTAPRALTGDVATYAGGLLLLTTSVVGWFVAQNRSGEKEAVVISTDAPMLDETGVRQKSRALDQDAAAIPEGASVFVAQQRGRVEQRGRLVRVYWGSTEAWLEIGQLRFIDRDLEL
jgi:hypothetical protein